MREFDFFLIDKSQLNSEVISKFSSELSEYLPNIETLALKGYFSNLNLDNLINLKNFYLSCDLMDDFNFDIFKSICNQLEDIAIICETIDDKFLAKFFYDYNFPYLHKLVLSKTKITKLEKKFFDRFPMLQKLLVCENRELRKIDYDAFSNSKHLISLFLNNNCIESIDKKIFSNLTNIETLVLDGNPLGHIEENVFSDLKSLRNLCLSNIQLSSLGPKSLSGLNNLKCLILKDNKLTTFDFDILDNIRQISFIDLSGNPIINKVIIWYHLGEFVTFNYC